MATSSARIMIAALRGRSGKTVLTLGLLRALAQSGLSVQPFKKGPDFIDPGWHYLACKRKSRNLDSFFMQPKEIRAIMLSQAEECELSIIEGAMGLYDGSDLVGSSSSAEIAKITQTPVVLVVDVTRMTRTAAALVLGCMQFDSDVHIAGVILNRVRGRRHEELIRASIESSCSIPVIGAVPVDKRLSIPDRHLGLTSSTEVSASEQLLDGIADVLEEYVDLEAFVSLARQAKPLADARPRNQMHAQSPARELQLPASDGADNSADKPRIAVIRDAAFCFYYEENLQALKDEGAELVFVDSLTSHSLPRNIHALYIGGGFPEEYAAALEANTEFRSALRASIEAEMPVYAECGGLMYLGQTIEYHGKSFEMVGALELTTSMQEKRQAHGYSVLEVVPDTSWLAPKTVLKGHEFHHSLVTLPETHAPFALKLTRGSGLDGSFDGIVYKKVLALYTHVNALASPTWAEQFVRQARRFKEA